VLAGQQVLLHGMYPAMAMAMAMTATAVLATAATAVFTSAQVNSTHQTNEVTSS
jgi:hypothetical protein